MPLATRSKVYYPDGDGKPMAETPIHGLNLSNSIAILQEWLKDPPDKFVAGNMCLYYVEGDPCTYVSPDVFVVLGVPGGERNIYQTWAEPKPTLDFVIEFTSRKTRTRDERHKFLLYQNVLCVKEYVLFNPLKKVRGERMYRLENGIYQPVPPIDGRLPSEVLNLHIDRDGRYLRFWNPATRAWLPTPAERAERAQEQAEQAQRQAKQAQQQAEKARQELEEERRRAEAALLELERLKAELAALRKHAGE